MRAIRTLALLALLAAPFLACGDATGPGAAASLRFVNAAPAAPAVDVYIDGRGAVSGLFYGQTTPSYLAGAGAHTVSIVATGSTIELYHAILPLDQSQDYTLLLVGAPQALDALLLADPASPPASGSAQLRLVHAAPTAGPVDVYVTE